MLVGHLCVAVAAAARGDAGEAEVGIVCQAVGDAGGGHIGRVVDVDACEAQKNGVQLISGLIKVV